MVTALFKYILNPQWKSIELIKGKGLAESEGGDTGFKSPALEFLRVAWWVSSLKQYVFIPESVHCLYRQKHKKRIAPTSQLNLLSCFQIYGAFYKGDLIVLFPIYIHIM